MDINNVKLGVIGCGKMASAILKGAVNSNKIPSSNIYLYDISEEKATLLQIELYSKICFSLEEVMKSTNAILIATKPFALDKVLEKIIHCFQLLQAQNLKNTEEICLMLI